jgi:hypothetical protein
LRISFFSQVILLHLLSASNPLPQIEKLVLSAVRVLVNLASAPPAATTLARDVCPVLMAALGAVDESSGVAASAAVTAFQRSVPLLQLVAAFVANLAHHRRCIPELLKHRVCGP